jgi:TPR repeat protein
MGAKLDAIEAYYWYSLAIKHGSAVARKNILEVEKQLSAEQKLAVRRRAASWRPSSPKSVSAGG